MNSRSSIHCNLADVVASEFDLSGNTPVAFFHHVIERRAGGDTAGVIASNSRDLSTGTVQVGNIAPNPGHYWEVAVAVVTARS